MKQYAIQYRNAGLSVLPANVQLKFAALPQWKAYQRRLPTEAQVQEWFANGAAGLCIVTGAVSGNLEMIDFDLQAQLFEPWRMRVQQAAPDLLSRLTIETSQSGGRHVIYRCDSQICGNLKLAQRKLCLPSGDEVVIGGKTCRPRQDKEGNWSVILTLIETRGQGGLFLCAPTPGYTLVQGDLTNLPVLSAQEREFLLEAAWSLNEYIPEPERLPQATGPTDSLRPGDDYNARGDVSALLQSHGWSCVKGGDNEYWRRPGKTVGWSATLKDKVFYVWSANAHPFEPEKAYAPFTVYALLEHGGDFRKAAAELSKHGYGQKPEIHTADVDLSGILASPDKSLPEDPGPIPEELFTVPGFIQRLMRFCLDTAPYPNKALAFCGALALQSFLAGRKIKEPGGIRTNIYLLALASTGTGKDWPRKINANLLHRLNASRCLGNRFASGEGIQDVMLSNLNMLFQTDEIDTMLRCINTSRESRYESIQDTLLTFYTSSDSSFPMRTKAGMKECVSIRNPHLSIFGTATPKNYYQALSERMMTSGFFSRMLIVDVGHRPLCERAGDIEAIPQEILEVAEFWQEKTRASAKHNLSWENPIPPIAPYQGQAGKLLFEFQRQSDLQHRAAEAQDEVAKAVWSRAAENARKLALLYACSENHRQPAITEQAVRWAIDFVNHQIRRQIYMAGLYAAENKFHADCLKLKEKLRQAPGRKMQHSDLLKNMRMDKDTFKKLVDTMCEQGDIQIETMEQVTKKGVFYKLCTA